MDQGADELPVPLDVVPQAGAAVLPELGAVWVDELRSVRQPVDEVERGVAKRMGERVTERGSAPELDEQVGDAAPRQSAPEHAGEECDRYGCEGDEEDVEELIRRLL